MIYDQIQASLNNVLPVIGSAYQIYVTVIYNNAIDGDNSLHKATIINCNVLYGNVQINNSGIFIALDNLPIAIGVTSVISTVTYFTIFYSKAIYSQSLPNNYIKFVQKIPKGIFNDINPNTLIGQISQAKANMLDDYYQKYFFVQNQVYSNDYSTQLEFQYNGTIGLLSNSMYLPQLFNLLASINNVALNVYDLELFISKYIYYRLGVVCAIYINDNIDPLDNYWELGINGKTELDSTAILAPDNLFAIQNLIWNIFNSDSFLLEFKQEIQNLIIRMSRADVGNIVQFFNDEPTDNGFTLIGATYPNDPRLIYNRCLQYLGDEEYPLNILGYTK